MKNGVPYDVAWTLTGVEVLAHCVAFGTFEGGEFDWDRLEWRKRD